jgi:hypothetical protein
LEEIKILIKTCTIFCGVCLYAAAWKCVIGADLKAKDDDDKLEKSFKILGKAFLWVHLITLLGAIIWAWI